MIEKIKEIIADKYGLDVNIIEDSSDIREDLGFDSLDIIELVMAIEKEFDISISDDVYDKVRTFGDLVNVVKELKHE